MNDNNSWQRMAPFVRVPRHNLGSMVQPQGLPPASMGQPGGLVPMGQVMNGGGTPLAPAMMPRQQTYQQPEEQPATGKQILGMPKDRFVALMGTIAQAFGGDSASGRLGAGLVHMADLMRQERVGQGKARASGAKGKQTKADALAKEKRARAEKRRNQSPVTKSFRVKDEQGKERDVPFSFNRDTRTWEKIPGMQGKGVTGEGKKSPTIRTFRIADEQGKERDVQHAWDQAIGKWEKIPGMPGKEVKKEEDKTPSFSEKRQRAKELRQAEATALGVDPKTGTPNADYPEVQVSVDFFNEKTNKSYVLKRTQGAPAVDKGLFEWGLDKEAIPGTIEKVPIKQFKTPEDVMNADYLSMAAKRRLLLKLFPDSFGD